MGKANRWSCFTARCRPSAPRSARCCRSFPRPGRSSPLNSKLTGTPPTLIGRSPTSRWLTTPPHSCSSCGSKRPTSSGGAWEPALLCKSPSGTRRWCASWCSPRSPTTGMDSAPSSWRVWRPRNPKTWPGPRFKRNTKGPHRSRKSGPGFSPK